jgi:hypothetical protein
VTCQGMWNELPRRLTLDKRSVAKLRNSGTRLCNSKESSVSPCRAKPSRTALVSTLQ